MMSEQKKYSVERIRTILSISLDSSPQKVSRFFKTGLGDYAQYDQFLGITAPTLRSIAKKFSEAPFDILQQFLESSFNEERFLALVILILQYEKGDPSQQDCICKFYKDNRHCVNNWNLVDISAPHILGQYLWDKDRSFLIHLAHANDLWNRRMAIVSTFFFIKRMDFDETQRIVLLLIKDTHDLTHTACGWMLREIGKRDKPSLVNFLDKNQKSMARTMLRYAIEKFPENERKFYLERQKG